ncbi:MULTISPECIES: serine/threonine-protein kinase [Actinomadura]|uniref:non-specific serine/threonine protein kinase n=1 Tax=Actinomadura madurae TaxID=1993 RepID=A0A1I5X2A0_9ACTN|nr:serine/threonine-protein kinase [Actinomadura madurae]SFQ26054.1 serine/threonine protein kinase [Actinomadura madurae]SPT60768.1 Serine/threonine-protein kinase PrkC [Actinomadura madurae]
MSADLVLNHRYRLLERLAIGGMGEVWRASDEAAGRQVAVKLLRLELGSDMRARGRFESEARFAAELRHPGIARAFDYGEQDGRTFLVMELVAGEPLDEILARDGGLPVEAVLDLIVQAGRALTVAHEAGIVHRDVKPANLMVSPDGRLKITDFGIARRLAAASQTQTGMVMGTAHYISPEQAQGLKLSPAADLYSLGVVAYECLTGAPPFDGPTPVEVALKHVRDAPAELPARVPEEARELVMEMLAKEPRDRPADAHTVAARALAIRAGLSTGRISAVPAGPPRPGRSGAARPGPGRHSAAGGTHIVTQSSALSGFDDTSGADSLANGSVPGQRRTVLAYVSVAAALLVCVIVIGSLWKGLAFAGSGKDERDPPATPATLPVGDDGVSDPTAKPGGTPPEHSPPRHRSRSGTRPAVPPPHRTHRIRPSTQGAPRTSPTRKPSTNPPRATPTAPEPTPTPTESPTNPSTPSPDPPPTPDGKLGSGDKV